MPRVILSTWFPLKPFIGACPSKNLIVIRKDWWEAAKPHARLQAVTHELAHIKQRRGDPLFNLKYFWALLTKGYQNNHYEQNARENEHNHEYQEEAKALIRRYLNE